MHKFLFALAALMLSTSCGVKGDPLPPGSPVKISRGDPEKDFKYKRFRFPENPKGVVLDEIDESEDESKK